ncbi:VOC family protein, partial [Hyphomicrobium sp.]|uniref:VOC family protein n=1 Tax=Hyphomicrobium sp. TaxID=82 RepID=UPI0025BEFC3E
MTASSTLPAPNLMPLMRYRDLAEAMGWLERAFGFEKQIAVSDGDGAVIYGQMTYRGSLMMMGAVRDTDLDKLMRQPDEVGGIETQSCYLVVEDADAHYARAQEAGADIVLELKSDGLGRRGYSCRDPEGHIWNFGTYNPGKGLTMPAAEPAVEEPAPEARRRSPRLLMGIAGLLLALGAASWWFAADIGTNLSQRIASAAGHHSAQEAERAYAELVKVRADKRKAEEAAEQARKDLEAERARRLAIESSAGQAAEKLAHEEQARRAAESAVTTLRAELERKQDALDAA